MKPVNCPQEAAIAKAARAGSLDESFASHAASCAICREILQTSSWMQAFAQRSETNRKLPDASLVWWKARLSETQRKTEKAQDFYELLQVLSAAVISLGVLGSAAWFAMRGLIAWNLAESWLSVYSAAAILLLGIAVACLFVFAADWQSDT